MRFRTFWVDLQKPPENSLTNDFNGDAATDCADYFDGCCERSLTSSGTYDSQFLGMSRTSTVLRTGVDDNVSHCRQAQTAVALPTILLQFALFSTRTCARPAFVVTVVIVSAVIGEIPMTRTKQFPSDFQLELRWITTAAFSVCRYNTLRVASFSIVGCGRCYEDFCCWCWCWCRRVADPRSLSVDSTSAGRLCSSETKLGAVVVSTIQPLISIMRMHWSRTRLLCVWRCFTVRRVAASDVPLRANATFWHCFVCVTMCCRVWTTDGWWTNRGWVSTFSCVQWAGVCLLSALTAGV